jgi:hypothetical protein
MFYLTLFLPRCPSWRTWERRKCFSFKKDLKVLEILDSGLQPDKRRKFNPEVSQSKGGDKILTNNWCHDWAMVSVLKCIDDSRPSKHEVVALVYTMLESMMRVKTVNHDGETRNYNPVFPVSLPFYQYISLMQHLQ